MPSDPQIDSTFTLYRRGIELLEEQDFEEAAAPLEEAARRAPEKASVREALGRAYFRSGRFAAPSRPTIFPDSTVKLGNLGVDTPRWHACAASVPRAPDPIARTRDGPPRR